MKPEIKIGVLLVCAVITWGSIFCFAACTHSPGVRAKQVAEKALLALADDPESVKIIAVSKAEPVYNREYVTPEEKMKISMAMMKVNEKVMKQTDGFENFNFNDKGVAALMERQMSAIAALRSILTYEPPHGGSQKKAQTGWKVKIEYQGRSADGKPYRSEYWFLLDRKATCVVKSFEIPIV